MSRRRVKVRNRPVYCPHCRKFYRCAITDKAAKNNKTGGYPYLTCFDCLNRRASDRHKATARED